MWLSICDVFPFYMMPCIYVTFCSVSLDFWSRKKKFKYEKKSKSEESISDVERNYGVTFSFK